MPAQTEHRRTQMGMSLPTPDVPLKKTTPLKNQTQTKNQVRTEEGVQCPQLGNIGIRPYIARQEVRLPPPPEDEELLHF